MATPRWKNRFSFVSSNGAFQFVLDLNGAPERFELLIPRFVVKNQTTILLNKNPVPPLFG